MELEGGLGARPSPPAHAENPEGGGLVLAVTAPAVVSRVWLSSRTCSAHRHRTLHLPSRTAAPAGSQGDDVFAFGRRWESRTGGSHVLDLTIELKQLTSEPDDQRRGGGFRRQSNGLLTSSGDGRPGCSSR